MDANSNDAQFEMLLDHLKRMRGFDFTGYKRPSLMRRVKKRMQEVGVGDYVDYLNCLELHQHEFADLFNTILINVTTFFRDQEAWDFLARTIVPEISKNNSGDIRVWSAGCASGEEAYSIAILLCEALGPQAFRARVKIYATDIDEQALTQARSAVFNSSALESVDPELREKYFLLSNSQYMFRPDLRRCMIFGRHDLMQDAPISKLDLLLCRNTLMYMNSEMQQRILARLHFALKDGGFLFLGKAEMLVAHSERFSPVDLKYRIFSKTGNGNPRERFLLSLGPTELAAKAPAAHALLSQLSLDASVTAQIVMDVEGRLRVANEAARHMFGVMAADIGCQLQDLKLSYEPLELRSLTQQALADLRTIHLSNIAYASSNREQRFLDVQVLPLVQNGGKPLGVSILFSDTTSFHELCDTLKSSHEELETTNEELQATNEELETTNEELQSTNEELQTTNEELQSTHEELETTNEELQSTHEELQTTNKELFLLTEEKDSTNTFLASILSSITSGVIVIDEKWKVRAWNAVSEDLWGLRSEEAIGQPFFSLDIGLPAKQLRESLVAMAPSDITHKDFLIDTLDRRGKPLALQIAATRMLRQTGKYEGLVLLMYRSSNEHQHKDTR